MKLFNILDTAFDNFDNTVRAYLSKTFENLGLNYTPNQIFGVIYDGMKGIMQNIMFYIEDGMTEQNIYTATRRKSFYSLAKLSGYEPYYGSAATGIINIVPVISNVQPSQKDNKVFIRNHSTIFNINTGVSYVLMLPTNEYVIDISRPLMQHRLKIVQGVWTTSRFSAEGFHFETFPIASSSLFDKQYMKVTVNGEEYHQVPCVYDMFEDEHGYTISTGFDSSFEISFGNGVHGRSLQTGDSVVIEYLLHDGSSGNIVSPGAEVMKLSSNCYSSTGASLNPDEYFTISLSEPITGGTDADTVDMIKRMIGYNSRSLVLASEDNYKQFLKRFSFIGRSTIYIDAASMTVTAGCLSNVVSKLKNSEDYLSLRPSEMLLTDQQKEMVKTTIKNSGKTFAGIKFDFVDPIIRKFAAICYVKVEEESGRDLTEANIRNAIAEYFMNLPETTTFIAKSDLITAALESDSNISAFDIDIISGTAEEAWKNGYWIKYQERLINGTNSYVPVKVLYESTVIPCMDNFGNISLDTKIEIPLLCGQFKYYSDKSDKKQVFNDTITIDPLTILFI